MRRRVARRPDWLPAGYRTIAEYVNPHWASWRFAFTHAIFKGMFGQRTVVFEDGSTLLFRPGDDYGYYGAPLDWGYP